MGDRFYNQQKNYKPKRVLKKDVIADLEELLGCKANGLDRMTIPNIKELTEKIERKLLS
jgi:hypothetical protein